MGTGHYCDTPTTPACILAVLGVDIQQTSWLSCARQCVSRSIFFRSRHEALTNSIQCGGHDKCHLQSNRQRTTRLVRARCAGSSHERANDNGVLVHTYSISTPLTQTIAAQAFLPETRDATPVYIMALLLPKEEPAMAFQASSPAGRLGSSRMNGEIANKVCCLACTVEQHKQYKQPGDNSNL